MPSKKFYTDHREQCIAEAKAWYAANKEKKAAYDAVYRDKHRAKLNADRTARKRKDTVGRLLNNARERAKRKGLECTITREDIVVPEVCPVLGKPFVHNGRKGNPYAPTLDRVDNAKGYVPGNVQVVSSRINILKNSLFPDEIFALAEYVYQGLYS